MKWISHALIYYGFASWMGDLFKFLALMHVLQEIY